MLWKIFFFYYLGLSLLCAGMHLWDKYQAVRGRWRVKEKTLHSFEWLGGVARRDSGDAGDQSQGFQAGVYVDALWHCGGACVGMVCVDVDCDAVSFLRRE